MVFQRINGFFLWVSWLYGFRVVLLIQALVCFWRGCLYFERSIYWNEEKEVHAADVHSLIIPALWTGSSLYALWVSIVVTIAIVCRQEILQWAIGTTETIGVSFYYMGKSVAVMGVLLRMVFLADRVSTPEIVDMNLTACFICAFLHIASVLKLAQVGQDFGFSDGILSVTVTICAHYARKKRDRLFLNIGTTFAVFVTNLMFSKCCRRCVVADELAAQTQDGGDDNQGNDAQSAGRSNEAADGEQHGLLDNDHDIDIESDAESVFYSPASGPSRRW